MQAFTRTTNVERAAALSTLGIEIQVDQTHDLRTGKGWKTILVANESTDVLGALVKPAAGEAAPTAPKHRTKLILGMLEKGSLAAADPHHPLLDMLGACANREALVNWIKTGTAYRIARVAGTRRTALSPGDEPESIKALPVALRTTDVKLAAALTRLGCPIISLIPTDKPDLVKFCFPAAGYPLDEPPVLIQDLVNAYRSDRLPTQSPEHPLLWMMQCLINREALLDFMFHQKETVLIRAPGTGRASLVRKDATAQCLDKVRQRLGITF